jgi:hypothetical protein
MGEKCTQSLIGNPQGKRPFSRPSCRWEDHIKIVLQDRIVIAQDRDYCEDVNMPSFSIKFVEFMTRQVTVSFSGSTVLRGVLYEMR